MPLIYLPTVVHYTWVSRLRSIKTSISRIEDSFSCLTHKPNQTKFNQIYPQTSFDIFSNVWKSSGNRWKSWKSVTFSEIPVMTTWKSHTCSHTFDSENVSRYTLIMWTRLLTKNSKINNRWKIFHHHKLQQQSLSAQLSSLHPLFLRMLQAHFWFLPPLVQSLPSRLLDLQPGRVRPRESHRYSLWWPFQYMKKCQYQSNHNDSIMHLSDNL